MMVMMMMISMMVVILMVLMMMTTMLVMATLMMMIMMMMMMMMMMMIVVCRTPSGKRHQSRQATGSLYLNPDKGTVRRAVSKHRSCDICSLSASIAYESCNDLSKS